MWLPRVAPASVDKLRVLQVKSACREGVRSVRPGQGLGVVSTGCAQVYPQAVDKQNGDHPDRWSPFTLLAEAGLQGVQLSAQQRRQLLADLLEPLLDQRDLRTPFRRVELQCGLDVLA